MFFCFLNFLRILNIRCWKINVSKIGANIPAIKYILIIEELGVIFIISGPLESFKYTDIGANNISITSVEDNPINMNKALFVFNKKCSVFDMCSLIFIWLLFLVDPLVVPFHWLFSPKLMILLLFIFLTMICCIYLFL